MVLLIIHSSDGSRLFDSPTHYFDDMLHQAICSQFALPFDNVYITTSQSYSNNEELNEFDDINVMLRVCGGIDFQHREGSKIGSGRCSLHCQFNL